MPGNGVSLLAPEFANPLAVAGGYLLGSISFGLIAARLAGLGDLRKIGSGNIGATNVLRTGNKAAALVTLIGDGGKGTLAVVLARLVGGETAAILAGLAAFLGHLYPVWLKFKGGKGVATFLGINLGLYFPTGLLACLTWLIVAFLSRYSSLSALVVAALAPIFLAVSGLRLDAQLMSLVTLLIFLKHAPNIRRLIAGNEPRIGEKKAQE